MHRIKPYIKMTISVGFVTVLAAIGLASHAPLTKSVNLKDTIDGSLQSAYEKQFQAKNPLQHIAINTFGAMKYALFGQASQGAIIGSDGWVFTAEELEVHPNFDANTEASVAEIARVSAVLSNLNINLLPVILPDKAEVYQEYLPVQKTSEIQQRREKFMSQLALEGITALDTSYALNKAKHRGDVFMQDDTHWSPFGSKTVAEKIAEVLNPLDLTKVNVSTKHAKTAVFDGDLLAFMPTGAMRPYLGPVQHHIDQYVTTVDAGGSLFGDLAVDVVLVGTSFSAKPEWHFEGFLKQALGADLLNFATEGQGPFAPMDAFLASEILKTNPPKVVIWEIPVRYISKEPSK